nr:hypothetical protein [Tanacetum cinerariifolium]
KQNNRSTKGYHEVPPPLTGNYKSPKCDLRLIDEHFESESVDVSIDSSSDDKTVKTVDIAHKGVLSIKEPKYVMKNNFGPPIIEDWHSDDDSEDELSPTVEGNPQQKDYKEKGVIDSGYSRHMTGNKCYLTDLEAFDGGFVSFGDGKGIISRIENQLYCKVKVTKSDNETEFKNSVMTQLCDDKGIKREYNVARTPQQNRVAERRNKTLIEAARTMALVTKPQNKTPYELIRRRPPLIDFMKPFGCPVTILNTRDNLGMFEGKADEGYLLGTKEKLVAGQDEKKKELEQEYILIPICTTDAGEASNNGGQDNQVSRSKDGSLFQQDRQTEHNNSANNINTVSSLVSTAGPLFVNAALKILLNASGPSAIYQMDVKSAFLYGKIEEEVYVCQPPSFEDLNFLDKVYKVEKALYGLHQASRACLDKKYTTEGCQFLDKRLILWKCKKQTIVANSTTEAEYVATANCCGQVLWIQNQLLDYGLVIAKDEGCFVDTSEVTTGNTLLNTARLTTAGQSSMASAIICLADNQKFNFSKYIFDNLVKSLEGGVKFYLFLRFLQVFLDNQVEGMARHKEMYVISSHSKKIFANMRRIKAGFSRAVTPLFDTMMVQANADMDDTPRKEEEVSHDESDDEDHVLTPSSDPLPIGDDSYTLNELMKKVSKLLKWRKTRSGGLRRLMKIGSCRRVKSPLKKDSLGEENDDEMFGVDDLSGEEVVLDTITGEHEEHIIEDVSTAKPVTTAGEVVTTVADKVSAAPTTNVITTAVPSPRAKGIIFHEQKQSHIPTVSSSKDKGKAKMIEPEVHIKKKDRIGMDEEYARQLEAKEQEATRLSRAQ